jgi:hypothetical protein
LIKKCQDSKINQKKVEEKNHMKINLYIIVYLKLIIFSVLEKPKNFIKTNQNIFQLIDEKKLYIKNIL